MGDVRSKNGTYGTYEEREMKKITKTFPPASHTNWCEQQQSSGVNYNYKCFQNPEKREFHEKLLQEQGSICGYTMKKICIDTSHIEHVKPRHICVDERKGLDLDYHNLIACYPREGMVARCRYGAQYKDKWWVDNGIHFIAPTNPNCESFFVFSIDGSISPIDPQNEDSLTTIQVLKLDDGQLINDRFISISSFIYGENGEFPIDADFANNAIRNICDRTQDDNFYEFCIAIRDALLAYLQILQNIN